MEVREWEEWAREEKKEVEREREEWENDIGSEKGEKLRKWAREGKKDVVRKREGQEEIERKRGRMRVEVREGGDGDREKREKRREKKREGGESDLGKGTIPVNGFHDVRANLSKKNIVEKTTQKAAIIFKCPERDLLCNLISGVRHLSLSLLSPPLLTQREPRALEGERDRWRERKRGEIKEERWSVKEQRS